MVKRSVWKMNRLESPVLLRWLYISKYIADCGRWYLDIKKKRALGIYKNRYACVL